MVADVESPLIFMAERDRFPTDDLEKCLKTDDTAWLQRLINDWGLEHVLNYTGSSGNPTSVHKAAEKGATQCLQKLLDARPNLPAADIPDRDGNTPLFSAVTAAEPSSVEILTNSNLQINARNDKGHSVLHWLVYSFNLWKDDNNKQGRLLQCLDIILKRSNIDLEAHDNSSFTPLLAASKELSPSDGIRRKGNLAACCRLLVSKGASLEATDNKGFSVRQIFEEKKALTAVLMGDTLHPPARPFASQLLDFLILGANGDFISESLRSQPQEEANRLANAYIGSQTILFYVVDNCYTKTVNALLEAGADPWKKQILGEELCIHRALCRGNFAILDFLIDHMKKKSNSRVLDLDAQSFKLLKMLLENYEKVPNVNLGIDHQKCLSRLFQPDIKIDINARSTGVESQTALHVAANHNNQEAMRLFIERGAFLLSEKFVKGESKGNILPVLRPSKLEEAMNQCIKYHPKSNDSESETENALDEGYTLYLNYQFLSSPAEKGIQNSMSPRNEVGPLMELTRNKEHRKAIKHPLIQTFLYAKWRKVLPMYLLNLFLYLSFVILLTTFMYTLKDLRILQERAALPENQNNSTLLTEVEGYRTSVNTLMVFLILVTFYMLVREIFQVAMSPKTYYKNFENYLEWILIIFVVVLCVTSFSVELTRHLAAWSMIIAWYEFVLLLGRAPPLAIYVTMLRHVSWNFLKLIFLYGALLLAFTVSFNIILESDDNDFGDFWSSVPKAIVMATGEFEYSDLSQEFSTRAIYSASAVLIFLVFLFLIFLVLMNVMNGLAVSDTQKVVDDATLYSLTSRLELIYLIEELLLKTPYLRRYLAKIQLTSRPRKPRLLARVNHLKFSERILYGEDEFCKLDRNTADILRLHRLQCLADEEKESKELPISECLTLLQEIRKWTEQHPSTQQQSARLISPSSSRGNVT